MGKILLLSNTGDIHCDFLIDACNRLGVECFRLNTDRFRRAGRMSFDARVGDVKLQIDGRTCQLQDVNVLVVRRPIPAHQLRSDIEPWVGRLLDAEWTAVENAISHAVGGKVLNGLDGSAFAQNKIVQLNVAHSSGLAVPDTLISTDIAELRSFADQARCITKGIVNAFHIDKHNLRSAWTSFVDPTNLVAYDPVGCPTFLQKAVEPTAIWRLVAISGTVFGFRFHGPELAIEPDSRKVERNLDGAHVPVPSPVSLGLVSMCAALGIEFASADFIEDRTGTMWFLDLNPEGQWAYLEDRFEVRISDAIVSLALN